MSQVDELVRERILTHPTSYPNRTEVLHQILCVLGSGYEWSEDGSIVSTYDDPTPYWTKEGELASIEARLDDMFSESDPEIADYLRDSIRPALLAPIEDAETTVQEIDARMHAQGEVKHFYPQSNWSLLMNIPSNVTPEWQEACEEMRETAVKAGWAFE